ncbi:Uncharacterised protein [Mycobacteroides abscessus subsp. abscessus]|nr:Uncharacterised protein [Mycobacteroides abscessus subsp. abscessus]
MPTVAIARIAERILLFPRIIRPSGPISRSNFGPTQIGVRWKTVR